MGFFPGAVFLNHTGMDLSAPNGEIVEEKFCEAKDGDSETVEVEVLIIPLLPLHSCHYYL